MTPILGSWDPRESLVESICTERKIPNHGGLAFAGFFRY